MTPKIPLLGLNVSLLNVLLYKPNLNGAQSLKKDKGRRVLNKVLKLNSRV